jgi:hypothetical protein
MHDLSPATATRLEKGVAFPRRRQVDLDVE